MGGLYAEEKFRMRSRYGDVFLRGGRPGLRGIVQYFFGEFSFIIAGGEYNKTL